MELINRCYMDSKRYMPEPDLSRHNSLQINTLQPPDPEQSLLL